MTAVPLSTRELFARALDIVRSTPLDDPDRPPLLIRPGETHLAPSHPSPGEVSGLEGDLWDTSAALASGGRTVESVNASARARADAFAGRFGAYEYLADTSADVERLADEARAGFFRSSLHGLPISVKDIIDVAGMPTTGSSLAVAPRLPTVDAVAVARLRAAGAVITGKAATHEFALGVTTPQARSPWDLARVPGGSSGGSAITLTTGMALGSLGTDTRASIRVPAALCGLVGFKPSYGVVPVDRWFTLSWTMDHFAPMARSVRDIALLMDALTASASREWSSTLPATVEGKRFGYSPAFLEDAEPGVLDCFDAAVTALREAGASVAETPAPTRADLDLANGAGMVVSRAEAAQFHADAGTDIEHCIPEVRSQLEEAAHLLATDYLRALRLRGQLRDRLLDALDGIDALIMPTSRVVAPPREEAARYLLILSENCIPWSFVDFPAISIHAGLSEGLPVGIQLVGRPGGDRPLLAAAYGAERVLPQPPIWSPD